MQDVGRIVVSVKDIHNGAAVRDHEALEPPCVAQVVFDQHGIGAVGGAVIGLSIVKQLGEGHGGKVGAESAGGVTRVWFSFPG